MKRLILSIVLVLLASCLVFGQAKPTAGQNVAQEITALENAWNEAAQKYDVSWFERNLADSYVYTSADGVSWTKPPQSPTSKTRQKILNLSLMRASRFRHMAIPQSQPESALSKAPTRVRIAVADIRGLTLG